MRALLFLGLPLIAGCGAKAHTGDAREYLRAKAHYDSIFSMRHDTLVRRDMAVAINDLEKRLRALTGAVSFNGDSGTFNAEWIGREGTEGGELDAIRFGKLGSDTVILITNTEVMTRWVRAEGDSSADPFVGLANDDVLTWVLGMNAHAVIYTDIRRHAKLPDDVRLALLITHSQDVVGRTAPRELVVGIQRGARVLLVFANAPDIPPPAECVSALDAAIKKSGMYFDEEEKVFLTCYDRVAPQRPEFQRAVAHVLEWDRIAAAKIP